MATVLLAGLLAPPAAADVRSGAGADPSSDQATAGRDLVGLQAAYDTAGTIAATATLRGTPADGFLVVNVGTPSGNDCVPPMAALGAVLDPGDPSGSWTLDGGTLQPLAVTFSGTTVTLRAEGPALANAGFSCAAAEVTEKDDQTVTLDRFTVPLLLAPGGPGAGGPAVGSSARAPAAGLTLKVSAPKPVRGGRDRVITVTVRNRGAVDVARVALAMARAKGITARPKRTRTLGTVRALATRTVKFRVRAGARAKRATRLTFTLRAGGTVVTRARTGLKVITPKK